MGRQLSITAQMNVTLMATLSTLSLLNPSRPIPVAKFTEKAGNNKNFVNIFCGERKTTF